MDLHVSQVLMACTDRRSPKCSLQVSWSPKSSRKACRSPKSSHKAFPSRKCKRKGLTRIQVWACCFSGQRPGGAGVGGGVDRAPPKHGGGFGKRAQLTGTIISYYEIWRQRRQIFLSSKTGQLFFH